jgi:hypothetical protein
VIVPCDNCGQDVESDLCILEVEDGEEHAYCCEACREEAHEEPEATPTQGDEPRPGNT